jgi:hypothetical protein
VLHVIVSEVDVGDSGEMYGPEPATVPATATVSAAPVHVAGVVKAVANAGGLPDHVPFAVVGAQEETEEQPTRYAVPGVPATLAVNGAAAVTAADENATLPVVFAKLAPPPPPAPKYKLQPLPPPPPP